jgi:hypothetical protein
MRPAASSLTSRPSRSGWTWAWGKAGQGVVLLFVILNSTELYTVLRIRGDYLLFRIRIFPSRIQGQKDSGSNILFTILNPKLFLTSQKISSDVHSGFGTEFFFPIPAGSRIQGSKKYRIRIRNTDCTLGGINFILFWNFNRNQTKIDRYCPGNAPNKS